MLVCIAWLLHHYSRTSENMFVRGSDCVKTSEARTKRWLGLRKCKRIPKSSFLWCSQLSSMRSISQLSQTYKDNCYITQSLLFFIQYVRRSHTFFGYVFMIYHGSDVPFQIHMFNFISKYFVLMLMYSWLYIKTVWMKYICLKYIIKFTCFLQPITPESNRKLEIHKSFSSLGFYSQCAPEYEPDVGVWCVCKLIQFRYHTFIANDQSIFSVTWSEGGCWYSR